MTLDEAIREYKEDGYEVTHVVESVCGGYEDWKIDYLPSRHLLTRA
jgi:hypothetical protein